MSLSDVKIRCEKGNLPHAILLYGGTAASRSRYASDLAKTAFAAAGDEAQDVAAVARRIDADNYPDMITIKPDGGSIKVDAVKNLIERLRYKPFEAGRVIAIIEDGDLMNQQAQNKLLKTLEEPVGENVIIILTANTEMLRQTIRSRCMKIGMDREFAEIDEAVRADAKDILSAALFGKPAYEAFRILDKYSAKETDDGAMFLLLDAMELFLRDLIAGRYGDALVADEANLALARKMREREGDALEAGVAVIEDTRTTLRFGRMNRKNSLRDMALRIRDRRN
jgi:hypothetical protein